VVQVGLRVEPVDEGRARGVDGREVVLPLLVADVDDALGREELPVAVRKREVKLQSAFINGLKSK
jgi:hypothetical protein